MDRSRRQRKSISPSVRRDIREVKQLMGVSPNFGSAAWQTQMRHRILNKMNKKQPLNAEEKTFMQD